jgi:tRNA-2-methylthio-N6-dimethylallyladenosine synthase
MDQKKLFIQTIGCQMNVYDSERIAGVLAPLNYKTTNAIETADLIIVNTCAIRQKAEQKVFSFLGRLARMKQKKPHLIIGVGGCVAQQEGEKIFERVPFIDVVFGTHAIGRLAGMIKRVEKKHCRLVDVELAAEIDAFEALQDFRSDGKITSFVTIMQGCDNYCTYCVVPYVRGTEASRHPDKIIQEIQDLVACGVREVTLLGQNVNSYGQKEGHGSFPQLLARINAIPDLYRIRFTTSHPKDLSSDLSQAFRDLDKLCKHIHLPVQSGSDLILKRMNRKYNRGRYLAKVDELRQFCPDIAISSDFIVGFPGETDQDFEQTLDLIQMVGYDSVFAFKYSDRPSAPAARFSDKISEKEKNKRLQILLESQDEITVKKHRALVGSTREILVEGLSKKQVTIDSPKPGQENGRQQWTGRTSTNRIVNFEQEQHLQKHNRSFTGRLVQVKIKKAYTHSLWGTPVRIEPKSITLKGEHSYAA